MFKKRQEEINIDQEEEEVQDFIYHICKKCGNTKCYYQIKQLRALDEPPSQILKCADCAFVERLD